LPERDALRYGLAFVLAAELAYLGWFAPRRSILVILGWLIVLGTTRRIVSWSAVDLSPDPLLLVAPAGLVTLSVQAWRGGGVRPGGGVSAPGAGCGGVGRAAVC